MLIILSVSVSISLAAIVLSILSYNSQKIEQSDTNLVISKITDNVTNVAIKIDNIKSVATTAEFNIFQLSSQLNETNNSITSVATAVEKNITQLSAQLNATNSNIMTLAATIESLLVYPA